jgi:hypothetical protein
MAIGALFARTSDLRDISPFRAAPVAGRRGRYGVGGSRAGRMDFISGPIPYETLKPRGRAGIAEFAVDRPARPDAPKDTAAHVAAPADKTCPILSPKRRG